VINLNKDILWIISGQVAGLANNFILLKILTVNLSMSEYGYFTLWVSIMLFVRQVLYDPLSIVSAKESVGSDFLGLNGVSGLQMIRYITDRLVIFFMAICSILIIFQWIVNENLSINYYLIMGLIYLAANGAQGIYLNILNIIQERKWASLGITLDSFAKLILVIILFKLYEKNVDSAIFAVAISSFFVFVIVRNICKKMYIPVKISARNEIVTAQQLIKMSLAFLAPTLLIALKGIGDRLFMVAYIGVEELAAYNVLLQLGFIPMILIIGVIQTYTSSQIYKMASNEMTGQRNTIKFLSTLITKIISISLGLVFCSYILSNEVFGVFVSFEYAHYSHFLPYFVIAGIFAGVAGLLNVGAIGAFKAKLVGFLMFGSVLVGLIVQMMSIALYGFEGGVIGLIASNFTMILIFMSALWLIPLKNKNQI
jgi:O-antigen/teichoic acid export membrane protein